MADASWRLSDELTFTALTTAELARQPLTIRSSATGQASAGRLKSLHLERTAGAGTIVVTIRAYSAAATGKRIVAQTVSLDAAGSGMQGAYAGLDVLFEAGCWITLESDAGAAHTVKVVATIGPTRGA